MTPHFLELELVRVFVPHKMFFYWIFATTQDDVYFCYFCCSYCNCFIFLTLVSSLNKFFFFFCNMHIKLYIISFVFSCLHLSFVLLNASDVVFLINCMYIVCGSLSSPSICRCCCRSWPSGCWVSAWINLYWILLFIQQWYHIFYKALNSLSLSLSLSLSHTHTYIWKPAKFKKI